MQVDFKIGDIGYYGIDESTATAKGLLSEYQAAVKEEQKKEVESNRRTAYLSESDPLYMEWQYDQTAKKEQTWRDKVAEIKARYPLPSDA